MVPIVVVADCPTARYPDEKFVEDAFAKFAVPVKVGDAENTRFPVPVSSVRMARSFALVSIEVVAIFELKVDQSAAVRRPEVTVGPADCMLKVWTFPAELKPKPTPAVDEVANVCVPPTWPLSDVRPDDVGRQVPFTA